MAPILAGATVAGALLTITRRNPVAAVMSLVATFFALAGIPPLGGWYAKLVVFKAVLDAVTGTGLAESATRSHAVASRPCSRRG